MWVYRGILPHLEVFTGRAEDHLLQDEADSHHSHQCHHSHHKTHAMATMGHGDDVLSIKTRTLPDPLAVLSFS